MPHWKSFLACILLLSTTLSAQEIDWNHWSPEVLTKAQEEDKLIFIHIGANWCHWCHVMEQQTYTNDGVIEYLNENFISVEADQDANADLGLQFRAYGWPALIVMNSEGTAIRKVAGYRSSQDFLDILRDAVADPTIQRKESSEISSDQSISALWLERFYRSLDTADGGYNGPQKFVDEATFHQAMLEQSDARSRTWIDRSMWNAEKLLDPEWGGIYQYSTHYDWDHPHYEKLLNKQSRYIELFARWAAHSSDPNHQEIATRAIVATVDYVHRFLKDEDGRFYTAQDADIDPGNKAHSYFALADEKRLEIGIPRIDSNIYPDENGQMISALVYAWSLTGNEKYLEEAEDVFATWMDLRTDEGLFPHSDHSNMYFLNDQWSMIEAAKDLYLATDHPAYRHFVSSHFEIAKQNFYKEGKWLRWTGSALNFSFDMEWECDQLRFFSSWSAVSSIDDIDQLIEEIWTNVHKREHLEDHFAMPEFLLAEHAYRTEPGKAVISGSEDQRKLLRRLAILSSNGPFNIVGIEESDITGLDAGESGLFYCVDGRCELPVFYEEAVRSFGQRR